MMVEVFFLDINLPKGQVKTKDQYRLQHIYAYSLLMCIIEIRYNLHLKKTNIRKTSFGKPYINCKGLSINFNISHSGNMIAIAISDSKIGIDIEVLKPIKFDLTSYDGFFTSKELKAIIESKNRNKAFFVLWTQKEAAVKYSGIGLKGFNKNHIIAKTMFIDSFFLKGIGHEEYAVSVVCKKNNVLKNTNAILAV